MEKLFPGLHKFQSEIVPSRKRFFAQLAKGQDPDAIFITCSDSRVDPALITQTQPGQLFTIRNAGNIVPPKGSGSGEEASIEYGIDVLKIKDIVVCGHSHCGAMQGLLNPESLTELPTVISWLKHAEETKRILDANYRDQDPEKVLNITVLENVLVQLEHVRTLPAVRDALKKGLVTLHAWMYEIETGTIYAYDPEVEAFTPLLSQQDSVLAKK